MMFFTSLITPMILLVLYSTFLGNVFELNFISAFPEGMNISSKIVKSFVCGQILSSILSVSCITVAFSSNLLMVNDKVSGVSKDISVSPINKYLVSLSYFVSTFISTVIVNLVGLILCFIYTYIQGWLYSFTDVCLLVTDVLLLTLFGTALSSVVNFYLNSQGQVASVSAIVSAGYGFICGAYMPLSSFGTGLRTVLTFFPGTYATSLIHNHALRASFNELLSSNVPMEIVDSLKNTFDCNISFFGSSVSFSMIYLILFLSIIVLIIINVLQNILKKHC